MPGEGVGISHGCFKNGLSSAPTEEVRFQGLIFGHQAMGEGTWDGG